MDANTLRNAQALAIRIERLKTLLKYLKIHQQDNEPMATAHLHALRFALSSMKNSPELLEKMHATAVEAVTDQLTTAKKELEAL